MINTKTKSNKMKVPQYWNKSRPGKLFFNGTDIKYLMLCGPQSLLKILKSAVAVQKQYKTKWLCLCANKTLLAKTDTDPDLVPLP